LVVLDNKIKTQNTNNETNTTHFHSIAGIKPTTKANLKHHLQHNQNSERHRVQTNILRLVVAYRIKRATFGLELEQKVFINMMENYLLNLPWKMV